jgi:hypothetical protein
MIDFTRRRFLFGLAAVPLIVPAVKHFIVKTPELIVPVADGISRNQIFANSIDFGHMTEAQRERWIMEVRSQVRPVLRNFFFDDRGDATHRRS